MSELKSAETSIALLIRECDGYLREGRITSAAAKIKSLNLSQVPRRMREPLARICRRAGLFEKGLRLLQPIVRHEKSLSHQPSAVENSEYAALLSRIGSIPEALALLESVSPETVPEALLYRGYCYIMQWEYHEAARMFELFLNGSPADYPRLVASVNLASAYVITERFAEARGLLEDIVLNASQRNATRLLANAFELQGQIALRLEDMSSAVMNFNKAMEILGPSESLDQLMIQKGLAIVRAQMEGSPDALLSFRREALSRGHWDSLRETDLYLLKANFDQELFDHLVIGSPLDGYRRHVIHLLKRSPSRDCLLGGSPHRMLFDLETGEFHGRDEKLHGSCLMNVNGGKKIHQILNVLIRDFYGPLNLGSLFSAVYPDEYFNVYSSPLKVRQLISRARRWFEGERIPAQIHRIKGGYRFEPSPGLSVRVDYNPAMVGSSTDVNLIKLIRSFPPGTTFSAADACRALNMPRTGFHRLATEALSRNQLEKINSGKWTVYRIPRAPMASRKSA